MKYIISFGILILFFGKNLAAQSVVDSIKPELRIVKETVYLIEHKKLKNPKLGFNSEVDSSMIYYETFYENGKIKGGISYSSKRITQKYICEYDKSGDKQKTLNLSPIGETTGYSIYEYDAIKNLIAVKKYDTDSIMTRISQMKYDKNGNCLETIINNLSRPGFRKEVRRYNDNNQKIEWFIYKTDGNLFNRRTYKYDEKGNNIEQLIYKPDGSVVKSFFKYDDMNNLITHYPMTKNAKRPKRKSFKIEFEYIYDENGNWITKRQRMLGKLNMVFEREIEY